MLKLNSRKSLFLQIDPSPGTQLMLMIQLRGQNDVRLEPKELCASRGCSTIYETLYENDLCNYYKFIIYISLTFY